MKKLIWLLVPILILGGTQCKKKSQQNPIVHAGTFTYKGNAYALDKCLLDHYAKKANVYEVGIWMVSSGIFSDPNSESKLGGSGNYIGIEMYSTDTLLVEGDYYYSDTYAPMTWYEAELGYPFDWSNNTGVWEWITDGIINVSKQNGTYTFTFVMVSETGNLVEGYFTGGVTYYYWPSAKSTH